MGLFGFLKKQSSLGKGEPPIPKEEKKYYQPDSYYVSVTHPGTVFEKRVIPFQERKSISLPSKRGLYVAEILLLEYCSYGTYPNPKNGYPGFWWFEYGMRNVGCYLSELERRGFICMDLKRGKYRLTDLGETELRENKYVPIMHKDSRKTSEDARFGPVFNVWEINRRMEQEHRNDWQNIIDEVKAEIQRHTDQKKEKKSISERRGSMNPKFVAEIRAMDKKLEEQDAQLSKIKEAEKKYAQDKDIDALILFWEKIWSGGGLLFNGSKWAFRLPDLYIKQKRYDDALRILKKINNPAYQERKKSYIEKVQSAKKKAEK